MPPINEAIDTEQLIDRVIERAYCVARLHKVRALPARHERSLILLLSSDLFDLNLSRNHVIPYYFCYSHYPDSMVTWGDTTLPFPA